jgi:hypothetical protein
MNEITIESNSVPDMNKLDFSQLPVLDNKRGWLCNLGDNRKNSLMTFKHVFERAECALYFTAKFHSENNEIIKKGLLIVAISEFVSIEEALKIDSEINNISLSPLLIINTENPLLHIVKQLRNYNIHIGSSEKNDFFVLEAYEHNENYINQN